MKTFFSESIDQKLSTLIGTSTLNSEMIFLINLQKESVPGINETYAKELIMEGLINLYDDRNLDFLWFDYMNKTDLSHVQNIAA